MAKVRRIWRSREARSVRDALLCCAERGVLSGFDAGKLRLGRMIFTVLPRAGRSYRLVLDVDAGTLHVSGLLPGSSERSSLFKALKSFLPRLSADEPAPLRLDLVEERAGLALAMRVRDSQYEYCAGRLVACASEISRAFCHAGGAPEDVCNGSTEITHVYALESGA